jgi:hypothetical protein
MGKISSYTSGSINDWLIGLPAMSKPVHICLDQAIQSRQLIFSDNAAYMLYWIFQQPAFMST